MVWQTPTGSSHSSGMYDFGPLASLVCTRTNRRHPAPTEDSVAAAMQIHLARFRATFGQPNVYTGQPKMRKQPIGTSGKPRLLQRGLYPYLRFTVRKAVVTLFCQ